MYSVGMLLVVIQSSVVLNLFLGYYKRCNYYNNIGKIIIIKWTFLTLLFNIVFNSRCFRLRRRTLILSDRNEHQMSKLHQGQQVLLANLTNTQMKRLKSIQHKAARLVTRTPLREHITPVLKQLHWLPVECRITYKLMVLVYKCVNGTAPAYLCRLIQPKCRDSRLRQPSDLELHRPVPKKAIGTAAFGFVGPDRWNKLPERLRESASLNIFKRDLKTHLFSNPL